MAWYWWVLLALQIAIDIGLGFFLWVALYTTVAHEIKLGQLWKGMFAVAKNVDQRFAWNEGNVRGISKFLIDAFGLKAPADPGKPPPGEPLN